MFGLFGRKAKIRKAVDAALATVHDEDDLAEHAPIEALPSEMQAQAFGWLAVALYDDERYEAAKVSLARALALAPDEPDLVQLEASIAVELDDTDGALEAQQRAVRAAPGNVEAVLALAAMLIDAERAAEALDLLSPLAPDEDPGVDTRRAEALFVLDRKEEALEILEHVCEIYDAQLKQISAGDWQALKARADEAHRLRADVYAELHGREATIELAAAAGKLDANAGVNYRLLGAQLAATAGERVADVVELETPDATEQRGRDLLAREPASARGHVLVGVAQLRQGEVGAARKSFERACELDGRCFAAFLGIGAALDYANHGLHRRAARFAMPPGDTQALAAVVVDWPALTEAERRVVWASVQPLARFLPRLAERDVKMRILPIDVRATDVGLFEDAAGERAADDHRSYDALSGVATHGGAIAKVEELLDVVTDGGLTFAHELAHLVFMHMPEDRAEELVGIHERALEVGYASTEYALSNADEFFAVSYTDYLRHRHELPGVPEADDAEIQHDLFDYFDRLAR